MSWRPRNRFPTWHFSTLPSNLQLVLSLRILPKNIGELSSSNNHLAYWFGLVAHLLLVSGFFTTLLKNMRTSNWIISPCRDENKKYLKPPPSLSFYFMFHHLPRSFLEQGCTPTPSHLGPSPHGLGHQSPQLLRCCWTFSHLLSDLDVFSELSLRSLSIKVVAFECPHHKQQKTTNGWVGLINFSDSGSCLFIECIKKPCEL